MNDWGTGFIFLFIYLSIYLFIYLIFIFIFISILFLFYFYFILDLVLYAVEDLRSESRERSQDELVRGESCLPKGYTGGRMTVTGNNKTIQYFRNSMLVNSGI